MTILSAVRQRMNKDQNHQGTINLRRSFLLKLLNKYCLVYCSLFILTPKINNFDTVKSCLISYFKMYSSGTFGDRSILF